jgi:hypothetical protein
MHSVDGTKAHPARRQENIILCLLTRVLLCSAIVETPPHPDEARAVLSLKAMYSGCMDTETIEAAGLGPFLGEAAENGAVGGWPMVLDSWTNEK